MENKGAIMSIIKYDDWFVNLVEEMDADTNPEMLQKSIEVDPAVKKQEDKEKRVSSGLGSIKRYSDIAATMGAKRTYNYDQVESLFNTFLSQFKKPSEQKSLITIMRQKLIRPQTMFDVTKPPFSK